MSGTVTSCVFLRFRKGVFSPSSRVVCVQLCVRPVSPAPVSGSHRGGYTAARHPPLLRLGWVCRDVREQNRKKESLFASLARALTNTLLSLSPPPCAHLQVPAPALGGRRHFVQLAAYVRTLHGQG